MAIKTTDITITNWENLNEDIILDAKTKGNALYFKGVTSAELREAFNVGTIALSSDGIDLIATINNHTVTIKDFVKKNGAHAIKYVKTEDKVLNIVDEGMVNLIGEMSGMNVKTKGTNVTGTMFSDEIDMSEYEIPNAGKNAGKGLTINGNKGNDILKGTDGIDTINGGDGMDILIGGEGKDKLTGGKGGDVFLFEVGDGIDTITDADMSDRIVIADVAKDELEFTRDKNDLIIQYSDNDKVIVQKYFTKKAEQRVHEIFASDGLVENLVYTIKGNGKISGTADDDIIEGSENDDTISGIGGDDTLIGYGGNDTLTGGKGADVFKFTTTSGIDTITDAELGDKIVITDLMDVDSLVYKRIGNNLEIYYNENDEDNKIILKNHFTKKPAQRIKTIEGNTEDLVADLSNIAYTIEGAGKISGSSENDIIIGSEVDDTISAMSGNDIIEGGLGNDKLTGGKGNDRFKFTSVSGVDTITDAELGDVIEITDVAKDDLLLARDKNNLVIYYDKENPSDENKIIVQNYFTKKPEQRIQTIETSDADIDLREVKFKITGNGKISGTAESDIILGSNDDDTINAMAGDDEITAGRGNDKIYGTDGNNKIFFNTGDGVDTVYSGKGNDTLVFNDIENLDALAANLSFAMEGSNLKIKYSDNDIVILDGYGKNKYNSVQTLQANNGQTIGVEDLLAQYTQEHPLTISGTGVITGSDLNEVFLGSGKADTILALGGNDTITGGLGDDKITGGKGDDVINAGEGNNTMYYSVGDGNDTIENGGGTDTLVFEKGTVINSIFGLGNDKNLYLTYGNGTTNDTITIENYKDGSSVKYIQVGTVKKSIEDYLPEYNIIEGTEADEQWENALVGTEGKDDIRGNGGSDHFYGLQGDDIIRVAHSSVNDSSTIFYTWGDSDGVALNAGHDVVYGANANDTLYLDLGRNLATLNYVQNGDDLVVNLYQGVVSDTTRVKPTGSVTLKDYYQQSADARLSQLVIHLIDQDHMPYYHNGENEVTLEQAMEYAESGSGGDTEDTIVLNAEANPTFSVLNNSLVINYTDEYGNYQTRTLENYFTAGSNFKYMKVGKTEKVLITDAAHIQIGNDKANTMNDTANDDIIFAKGGNDTINVADGENYVNAGAGTNTIKVNPTHSTFTTVLNGGGTDTVVLPAGSSFGVYDNGDDLSISFNVYDGDELKKDGSVLLPNYFSEGSSVKYIKVGNNAAVAIDEFLSAEWVGTDGNDTKYTLKGGTKQISESREGEDTFRLGKGNDTLQFGKHFGWDEIYSEGTPENIDTLKFNNHSLAGGSLTFEYGETSEWDEETWQNVLVSRDLRIYGGHGSMNSSSDNFGGDVIYRDYFSWNTPTVTISDSHGDTYKVERYATATTLNWANETENHVAFIDSVAGSTSTVVSGNKANFVQMIGDGSVNYTYNGGIDTVDSRSYENTANDTYNVNSFTATTDLVVSDNGGLSDSMSINTVSSNIRMVFDVGYSDQGYTTGNEYWHGINLVHKDNITAANIVNHFTENSGIKGIKLNVNQEVMNEKGWVTGYRCGLETVTTTDFEDGIAIGNWKSIVQDKVIEWLKTYGVDEGGFVTLYNTLTKGDLTQAAINELVACYNTPYTEVPPQVINGTDGNDNITLTSYTEQYNLMGGSDTVTVVNPKVQATVTTEAEYTDGAVSNTDTFVFANKSLSSDTLEFDYTPQYNEWGYIDGISGDLAMRVFDGAAANDEGTTILYKDFFTGNRPDDYSIYNAEQPSYNTPNLRIQDADGTYDVERLNGIQNIDWSESNTNHVAFLHTQFGEGTNVVTSNNKANRIVTNGGANLNYTYGGGFDNVSACSYASNDTYNVAFDKNTKLNIYDEGGYSDTLNLVANADDMRMMFDVRVFDGEYYPNEYGIQTTLIHNSSFKLDNLKALVSGDKSVGGFINIDSADNTPYSVVSPIEKVYTSDYSSQNGDGISIEGWKNAIAQNVVAWLENSNYNSAMIAFENGTQDEVESLLACYDMSYSQYVNPQNGQV